jgi:ABC-2 type transport system ATP-binding protein
VNVREYLDFFARSYGLKGQERLSAIDEVMEFTQLDTLATKPIDGLSKGMKQRLCLGRTIIHNPSVLVLDEPAAGLDPRARIELREMIAKLAEAGKAILISSHILTELAEICDRVGIIEQGRLLAVGSVAEISAEAQVRSTVRVRVLEGIERLEGWLAARDDVSELRVDCDLAIFNHSGDRESEAALLRAIVTDGFPVVEFGAKHKSLEDVFLHVTEGRVQ